jgi:hypothetical protein
VICWSADFKRLEQELISSVRSNSPDRVLSHCCSLRELLNSIPEASTRATVAVESKALLRWPTEQFVAFQTTG